MSGVVDRVTGVTLSVHRAVSTDVLADGLGELLATPLADPFAEEVVAVPAKGVERWLAQRLSHRLGAAPGGEDGVCAGVRFLNPHSLVALVLGIEHDDPWHPDQLAWPVLAAIDASLGEPWAATLSEHLGHGLSGTDREMRQGQRYAVARRLAGLFADYAAQRPAMLADWVAGGAGDGLGGAVADDLAWQPELWRRVVTATGAEAPEARRARVLEALREQSPEGLQLGELVLPGRLSLFGHTRIARSEIDVLAALGEHLDVHLWLPQASPAAWTRLASLAADGPVPRRDDTSAAVIEHPLRASLGRDSRELQRTLALAGGADVLEDRPDPAPAPSLLGLLQGDLAADHAPEGAERESRVIGEEDRSIQVHACHGQARQVEVLRDVLTDLLERDPTLEPRDILVMCPDVDSYAPLVHAAFGLTEVVRDHAETHPAHTLRVRLADRGPRHTNPLLSLAERLVELAGGRLTAGEVLDLARTDPVRHRFRLGEDALERLDDWVDGVVIRWGLDAEHRARYGLPHLTQNTWRAGLDRVLVGAALDGREVDHLGTTLALDDLDSGDLDLAGRLAELVDRLASTLQALRTTDTVSAWMRILRDGVLGLSEVSGQDAWQLAQFERELARTEAAAARASGSGPPLALADIHALLRGQAGGRATRSNFRTGALTVCTMVPMRSVPHRVVCLVGLDDGAFPRHSTPDGDDALARRPVTGERDLRSEDRQLLLDAISSAGDTLVITYTGADEHTGAERPPAVPLGELIDAVRATATGPGVDRLVTRHPLQPYDPRNLGVTPADGRSLLPGDRPLSYDPAALAGAAALRAGQTQPVPIAGHVLPARATAEVALDDLLRFFDHPARAFLRARLGMVLPEVPEERNEGIPIVLNGLEKWQIGDRMLQAVLAGRAPGQAVNAELWRGALPPDALGQGTMKEITTGVQELCEAAWRVAGSGGWGQELPRESLDLDVTLPDGRQLTGTVTGLVASGSALTVTYSTVRAKQRLRSWIVSLALAAAGHPAGSQVIGKHYWGRGDKGPGLFSHGPHDPDTAREVLGQLVDLQARGMRGVVPLPLETSLAWAYSYGRTGRVTIADQQAARKWVTPDGGYGIPGEQDDPSWARVLGPHQPYSVLLTPPGEDERWAEDLESRLGQLALRLWGPLLGGRAETTVKP